MFKPFAPNEITVVPVLLGDSLCGSHREKFGAVVRGYPVAPAIAPHAECRVAKVRKGISVRA